MNRDEQLPSGWDHARVADLATVLQYGSSAKTREEPAGVPVLRMGNIVGGQLDFAGLKYLPPTHGEFPALLLERGDVLFNRTNSPELVGKTAVYLPEHPAPCSFASYLIRVRLENYDPRLFAAYLNSPYGRAWVRSCVSQQVGQANVSGGKLKELELPVPPLAEQKRIVAKIEQLTARNQRVKEALDAVPPLLDQLRQSVLAAAFRGDLTADWRAKTPNVDPADKLLARIRAERRSRWEATELAKMTAKGIRPTDQRWKDRYVDADGIDASVLPRLPVGWCWQSLGQVLAEGLANGRSVPTDDAGFPVLRLTALRHGQIDLRERKGGAWSAADAEPFLVRRDDFLVSRGNGSLALVGRGGLVEEDPDGVAFPDTLIRIRVVSLLDRRYLALIWNSRVVRDQVERSAKTTAGIFKVSQGDLEGIAIPVPDIREQRQIATRVSSMMDRIRRLEVLVASELTRAASLEASLLAKAFRGELVPQDPNDEPASALLERIRAARDSSGGEAPQATRRPRKAAPMTDALASRASNGDAVAHHPDSATVWKDLSEFEPEFLQDEVAAALWTLGPLDKDDAVRQIADHLRRSGHVTFQRLRADGPLFGQILAAIESAVKAGRIDRPKRGYVRSCKPDATTYTPDDWRHTLVASLGPNPVDRDDAVRSAAEWARDNLGLEFARLRENGHIVEGLRSALNSAIRRGDIIRHDAKLISRKT